MKAIDKHRQTWKGKDDEWLFERLENELKNKVQTIHEFINRENKSVGHWVKYDSKDTTTHPKKYGKYLVMTIHEKMFFETWNNTGFAYNNKVINYWTEIQTPKNFSE